MNLTATYDRDDQLAGAAGYKLRVNITAATGMDREVFVFRRVPTTPGCTADEFDHVASIVDMEDAPAGAPSAQSPWFRRSTVEFYFVSVADREDTARVLKEDINALLAALNLEYAVQEIVEHGEP